MFTSDFFPPIPNTEISTYVQKYKLLYKFSNSGPLATCTRVDFACAYTHSSNAAHKHYTFLKFQQIQLLPFPKCKQTAHKFESSLEQQSITTLQMAVPKQSGQDTTEFASALWS